MDEVLKKNLLIELGLDKMPPEQAEDILLQASSIIFQRIFTKTVPLLSEKEQTEFEEVLQKAEQRDGGALIFTFLKSKFPNIDDIVKQEIAEFKRESFDVMSKIGTK